MPLRSSSCETPADCETDDRRGVERGESRDEKRPGLIVPGLSAESRSFVSNMHFHIQGLKTSDAERSLLSES
jgi:hypothetical protein